MSPTWMANLPAARELSQVIMPGSDDAGLYTVTKKEGVARLASHNRVIT